MEGLDVLSLGDPESDTDNESTFSQYTARRQKMRKKYTRMGPDSPVEVIVPMRPQKFATLKYIVQVVVNLSSALFICTAVLGAVLNLFSDSKDPLNQMKSLHPDQEGDFDWRVAQDAAILAFRTTWQAVKLWSKLVAAILIPTSQQSYALTQKTFVALQPSLIVYYEFYQSLNPNTKILILSSLIMFTSTIYLVNEARKKQISTRIANNLYRVGDYFAFTYNKFSKRVASRSLFLASLLPHILFVSLAVFLRTVAKEVVVVASQGVIGWCVVIALPVILSTRALVIYDQLYLKRITNIITKNKNKKRTLRNRRGSFLPMEGEVEGTMTTAFNQIRDRLFNPTLKEVPEENQNQEEDENDDSGSVMEMRPYLKNRRQYSTMRGVRPLEYPKALDEDDISALQQISELEDVLVWLKYWMVLAVPLALEQLPVTGHLLGVLSFWPAFRLFLALWLQLPMLRGASLAFNLIVPLIGRYWQKIELIVPDSASKGTSFIGGMILAQLPIGRNARRTLEEIGETGGTLLFTALPLFFLPSFVGSIGCVFFGLLRPLYSGVVSIMSVETAAFFSKKRILGNSKGSRTSEAYLVRKEGSTLVRRLLKGQELNPASFKVTVAASSLHCTQWLEYWVVYTLFMFAHGFLSSVLFLLPFWTQGQLALVLWLQLPYFRGARIVFKRLLTQFYAWKARRSKNPLEPESKHLEPKESTVNDRIAARAKKAGKFAPKLREKAKVNAQARKVSEPEFEILSASEESLSPPPSPSKMSFESNEGQANEEISNLFAAEENQDIEPDGNSLEEKAGDIKELQQEETKKEEVVAGSWLPWKW